MKAMADDFLPPPPPGATNVQLEMWRRVIILRYQKIKNLPLVKFVAYYNAVVLDLETSRLEQVGGGVANNNDEKRQTAAIDLAAGNFSSCLIKHCPDPMVPDVARHLTALFYRSIDNRLNPGQRRHGLDAVRRGFILLDNALKDKVPISSSVSQQQQHQQQQQQQEAAAANDRLTNITDERAKKSSISLAIDLTSDNDGDGGEQPTSKEGGNKEHTNKRNRDDIIPSNRVSSENGQKKTRIDTDQTDTGEGDMKSGQEQTYSQTMTSTQQLKISATINEINSRIQVSEINSVIQASIQKESGNGDSKEYGDSKDERTPSQMTLTPQPTQPPNSGAITTTPSFPPPKPTCDMRHIDFLPDNLRPTTASASLEPRMSCVLRYDAGYHLDGSGATLDANTFISIRDRLEQWDPYWKVVRELGMREQNVEERGIVTTRTKVGSRTTSCMSAMSEKNLPTSCAGVNVEFAIGFGADYNPWGIRLGEIDELKIGDRRLLLRMLPLKRSNYDKKHHSDNHQWPIGTFIQYSNGKKRQVLSIAQRRQQSHDPTLWRGLCQPLDMTSFLQFGAPFSVQICAKEVIEQNGTDTELTGSYAIHLAVCEYITSEDLFANLLRTIQTLSLNDAREMAKKYLQNQTVSIDSDSEVGDFSSNSSLTFSLLCPISKKTMKTAVRGRLCKHIQCFDLETFIHSNKHITGGRWRCGVCENFLSVHDLIKCGLYEAILHLYKDTASADKVSFKSDGSWNLKDEKKQLRGVSVGEAKREIVSIDSPQKKTQPEIIDLM